MTTSFIDANVGRAFLGVLLILVASTVVLYILSKAKPTSYFTSLRLRVRSWWNMAGVFAVAIVLGRTVSLVFFGLISFLALKEYLSLIPTRRVDRSVLLWVYLAIPVQYLWVSMESYSMFIIFIPVFMFLFLPIRMMMVGETTGFLRAVGTIHWGLMMTVFSLSHAAFLFALPPAGNPNGGGAGLLLYLVSLTQLNDVSQFIWGKLLGRHKVVPKVSPGKTWEGLIGGVATTVLLAVLVAPLLTPLDTRGALFAGGLIGLAGFFGDVTISCLKRDLGIKDSGSLIPGHGGVLDRVDSLTYTAPLFFHFVRYFYFR
jgi:phosphatidate cytidylyltransferase